MAFPPAHGRDFVNYGIALLVLVTLVWGTTFPLVRVVCAHLTGLEISALRFSVAAICMLPFALKAPRAAWRDGFALGVFALVSYVSQAIGLGLISSNRSAFLTSTNVLMVPFLGLLTGARLHPRVLGAAFIACAGIGLMSWEGGGNLAGDLETLLCAVAYAVYVLLLSRYARRHAAKELAATQILSMALIGVPSLLAADYHSATLQSLPLRATAVLPSILYLGAVATAGMLFLQAIGQRLLSATKAAVIYALEPVFAALFGWWWLRESMGPRGLFGAALVIVAVILGEWRFSPGRPRDIA
jgi:drug/metabolite transporter (DMT)-like permease